jgi:hypothetical protein
MGTEVLSYEVKQQKREAPYRLSAEVKNARSHTSLPTHLHSVPVPSHWLNTERQTKHTKTFVLAFSRTQFSRQLRKPRRLLKVFQRLWQHRNYCLQGWCLWGQPTNQPTKRLTKGGVRRRRETSSLAGSNHSCVRNALLEMVNGALN